MIGCWLVDGNGNLSDALGPAVGLLLRIYRLNVVADADMRAKTSDVMHGSILLECRHRGPNGVWIAWWLVACSGYLWCALESTIGSPLRKARSGRGGCRLNDGLSLVMVIYALHPVHCRTLLEYRDGFMLVADQMMARRRHWLFYVMHSDSLLDCRYGCRNGVLVDAD